MGSKGKSDVCIIRQIANAVVEFVEEKEILSKRRRGASVQFLLSEGGKQKTCVIWMGYFKKKLLATMKKVVSNLEYRFEDFVRLSIGKLKEIFKEETATKLFILFQRCYLFMSPAEFSAL